MTKTIIYVAAIVVALLFPGSVAGLAQSDNTAPEPLASEIKQIDADISATKFEQAVQRSDIFIRSNPGYAVSYRLRGMAFYYLSQKRPAEKDLLVKAIADFTKGLSFYQDDVRANDEFRAELYEARGNAYELKGDHDAAVTDFAKIEKFHPGRGRINNHINKHLDKKDLSAVLRDFDVAIAAVDRQEATSYYTRRAKLHTEAGNIPAAISDLKTVMEIKPRLLIPPFMLWPLYMKQKDYASAVAVSSHMIQYFNIQTTITDKRKIYEIFNLRARAYAAKGDVDLSIADYASSIMAYPEQVEAYIMRAKLLVHKKRNPGLALTDLTFLIERENRINSVFAKSSQMAEPYFERGVVYAGLAKRADAIADLTKAIELDPKHAQAFFVRSIMHCEMKRLDLAKLDEAKVAVLGGKVDEPCTASGNTPTVSTQPVAPKTAKDWFDKGVAHYNEDDLFWAIDAFTKAIALKPNYWEAYAERASANFPTGGHEDAFVDINQAIKLKPKNASLYLTRSGFHCHYWQVLRKDKKSFDLAKQDEATVIKLGGKVDDPCK